MTGSQQIHHAEVERLAYLLWHERGCPIGSPEQDWLQAERMIVDGLRGTTPPQTAPQPGAADPVAPQPGETRTGAAPAAGTLAAKVRDEAAAAATNDPASADAAGSLRTADLPQTTEHPQPAAGQPRPRSRRAGGPSPVRRGG